MHSQQKKILVIKLGAFGDFVQALGVMKAIRKEHPTGFITLLTTPPFVDLAMSSRYVDECRIDVRPKWYQLKAWADLSRWLNVSSFERVYDLQNNDRTSLYFKLFRHKPEWVGVAKGASHRNLSPQRIIGHGFDGHIQTMALAGITDIKVDDLKWMDADISRFNIENPYILFVPGSAPGHTEKRWPAELYGELAAKLWNEYRLRPVLIGTSAEMDVIQKIIRICPDAVDLSEQTRIQDLPALARNAEAVLGNDTGPMHMIGPTGVPCLVLFSSASNPTRHKPLGENVFILKEEKLANLSVSKVMDEFCSRLLKVARVGAGDVR